MGPRCNGSSRVQCKISRVVLAFLLISFITKSNFDLEIICSDILHKSTLSESLWCVLHTEAKERHGEVAAQPGRALVRSSEYLDECDYDVYDDGL